MSRVVRNSRFLLIAILAALSFGGFLWEAPAVDAKTKIDADKIYYGDVRNYSRPAVVDAAKVYRQIPAHREILERKLTREDPEYWPLLRKASQVFVRALRKVCQEKSYDLVGEVNTISIDGQTIPDITGDVIGSLEKPKAEKREEKTSPATPPKPPAPGKKSEK